MSIKSHIPASAKDDSWYNHYVAKIGEESLFKIKNYVYDLCDKLQVGEHLNIETWITHTHKKCQNFKNWSIEDTTDLFVKIIWCYMLESNACYCFSNDYKLFKNYIEDARKMDQQSALHNREHQNKDTRSNGGGTWVQSLRTQSISAP